MNHAKRNRNKPRLRHKRDQRTGGLITTLRETIAISTARTRNLNERIRKQDVEINYLQMEAKRRSVATFNDSKEIVAIEMGYSSWDEFFEWVARDGEKPVVVAQMIESAMERIFKLKYM